MTSIKKIALATMGSIALLLGSADYCAARGHGGGHGGGGGGYGGRGFGGYGRGFGGYGRGFGGRGFGGGWGWGLGGYPYYGYGPYSYGYGTYPGYYYGPYSGYYTPYSSYGAPAYGYASPVNNGKPARVVIDAPKGAEVWLAGVKATLPGTEHKFHTQPLDPNQSYSYEVRARWTDANGKQVDKTEVVRLHGGDNKVIDFRTEQAQQTSHANTSDQGLNNGATAHAKAPSQGEK